MTDRALITGGAGFIGSRLVRKLTASGSEIHILIDDGEDISRLADLDQKIKLHKTVNWAEPELYGILRDINPTAIFHLRASINPNPGSAGKSDPYKINFEDTKQLALAASRLSGLLTFAQTGTIAEYGGAPAPFREDGPMLPISDYGRSKLAATEWLKEFYHSKNFPVAILRLSLVYGPGQKLYSLIPRVIASCLKKQDFYIDASGSHTRDPLFIDDAVDGFIKASVTKKAKSEVINLGLGAEYAILNIANIINDLLGKPIKILIKNQPNRAGENDHYWHDIAKAHSILGWEPEVSLEEGLKKSIAWYQAHEHEKE